eukprot:TRINITY_DN1364_c0_g1_i3.p3 TRINITY_DN1364_c0_g1~~TRINITY_DN1364_c0_g1_i3.p3  ORF type:complete len:104 (-),score=21.49 TRINITY_DN1364_c0_g1_i3:56-367(-)
MGCCSSVPPEAPSNSAWVGKWTGKDDNGSDVDLTITAEGYVTYRVSIKKGNTVKGVQMENGSGHSWKDSGFVSQIGCLKHAFTFSGDPSTGSATIDGVPCSKA